MGKYASDIGVFTLQMRLGLMAVVSVALFVGGIFLTRKYKVYGDILQATGLAGWMVTLFVAHVLTEQISWVPTLIAGVIGVISLGVRAVRQDSQSLAIVAYLGGFLAPFIASSEASSLWRLFSYMVLLNAAACLISAYKPWKWFTREFTIATFGLLGALMLAEHLQNDLGDWEIQLPFTVFTVISTLMFSFLAALWVAKNKTDVMKMMAGLLFGVPAAAAAALQAIFIDQSLLCAGVLAGLGIWYMGLFAWLRAWVLFGIGAVFLTGALPYALSDSLTTLVYSMEGAAFVWWATRYHRLSGFAWGLLLQAAAFGFAFHSFQEFSVRESSLHWSWLLFGAVVASGFLSAWWFQRERDFMSSHRLLIENALLVWSFAVWLYQWAFWLAEMTTRHHMLWWLSFVLTGTAAVFVVVARVLQWPSLSQFMRWAHLLFLAVVGLYLLDYVTDATPVRLVITVALVTVFAVGRYLLAKSNSLIEDWEACAIWLGSLGAASFALYHAPITLTDWNAILVVVLWLPPLFFMQSIFKAVFAPSAVRSMTRWVSLLLLTGWLLISLSSLGNYAPLPYWPLLHPLFLCSLAAGEILFRYARRRASLRLVWIVLMGMVVTVEINRWLFHYVGVTFALEAWLDSALTQTVWSLIWTLIGGLLMLIGARREQSRTPWLVGASILGLVVLKLFVLDLAQVDTLYRILSFIGVGALLLGIGYLAPMPKVEETLREGAVNGD